MDASSQYCAALVYTHSAVSYFYQPTGTDGVQQYTGRPMTFSIRVRCSTPNAFQLAYYDTAWNYGRYNTGGAGYETLTMTFTPAPGSVQIAPAIVFRASCTVYVDNAMLVLSTTAPEFIPLHPADDLHRCQRYYEELGPAASGTIICRIANPTAATYYADTCLRYQARKAVTPTTTKNGTWAVNNCAQPGIANNSVDGIRLEAATGPSATDSYAYNQPAGTNITSEANP